MDCSGLDCGNVVVWTYQPGNSCRFLRKQQTYSKGEISFCLILEPVAEAAIQVTTVADTPREDWAKRPRII